MRRFLVMAVLMCMGCSQQQTLQQMKFSGTVEITEHVLGFKAPGRVSTVVVNEGDHVKQGQQLATLDRYEQNSKDHDRLKALAAVGGSSPQSLEYAALALDDQEIKSPVDGIVLLKNVEAGEAVGAGAGIIVVGNPQDQWIKIFVPEGYVNQLKPDAPCVISFDGTSTTYQGHVSFIATKAEFTPRNVQTKEERVTQAFAVKIKFNNPDLSIRPGVNADVQFK